MRPRKDHRGVDLISDALPFGRLWYDGPEAVANAIGYQLLPLLAVTIPVPFVFLFPAAY